MINAITGRITAKQEGTFLLQCGPVEWALLASQTTLAALPSIGSECTVYTYVHHREDQLFMVGFSDELQRQLFLDLISVGGIGPKQGLRILSGLPYSLLINAIQTDDVSTLAKVPGMGKKTAQKVILSLKGRLVDLSADADLPKGQDDDIMNALVQMGYERQQVKKAVEEVASREETSDLSVERREAYVMKEAIRLMG